MESGVVRKSLVRLGNAVARRLSQRFPDDRLHRAQERVERQARRIEDQRFRLEEKNRELDHLRSALERERVGSTLSEKTPDRRLAGRCKSASDFLTRTSGVDILARVCAVGPRKASLWRYEIAHS